MPIHRLAAAPEPLGFLGYLLTYQLVMSPVSVAGYAQELFGAKRSW